ncbi:mitochondrial ribosomal small subunit component [Taxawa tesnikishii (nom. ined.)]|nr:mitochondrial ribosomal small subunit component [Dothideales sp. JES 119]
MQQTRALLGARSVWKGPHIVPLPIVRPKPGERAPPIKTQARSATILPNFVGLIFQVHNGKIYNDVRITEDMVGHKLGSSRRKFVAKHAIERCAAAAGFAIPQNTVDKIPMQD